MRQLVFYTGEIKYQKKIKLLCCDWLLAWGKCVQFLSPFLPYSETTECELYFVKGCGPNIFRDVLDVWHTVLVWKKCIRGSSALGRKHSKHSPQWMVCHRGAWAGTSVRGLLWQISIQTMVPARVFLHYKATIFSRIGVTKSGKTACFMKDATFLQQRKHRSDAISLSSAAQVATVPCSSSAPQGYSCELG